MHDGSTSNDTGGGGGAPGVNCCTYVQYLTNFRGGHFFGPTF